MKEQTMNNNQFLFRFKDVAQRQAFKLEAVKLNKSMNELLGEIVDRYFKEIKRAS